MHLSSESSRREFLKRSAALATCGVVIGSQRNVFGSPNLAEKMKRVGCTTVCFRMLFPATRPKDYSQAIRDLTLLDVPDLFAEKLGVHNVEVWSKHFDQTSLAHCDKVCRAAEKAGSRIINIQLDDPAYNLSDRDIAGRQKSVDFVKQWMDRAAACGATSLRANTGRSEGKEFDLDITVDSFRSLAEHGKGIGVKILIENHGANSAAPEKIVEIVKGVDTPWCRTLPDFGNVPPGADETFRRKLLKALFPYAHLVSAKGMWFDDQMQHVPYDIGECVRIGEVSGYQGIYSAEHWDPKARPADPFRVTKRIIELIVANL